MSENIEGFPSIKCPCGKVGRFVLYLGNDMKLCLEDMQYYLTWKLNTLLKSEARK